MLGRVALQSLAFSIALNAVSALDLDVTSQDSIHSATKSIARSIVSFYNDSLKEDHIPGLFPDPYYWWQAGAVFNGLIEYSYLTGDSQYDPLVSRAIQWQIGDYDAFLPMNQTRTLAHGDQSTWALTALTAAEVGFSRTPSNAEWVDYAINVFNIQVLTLQAEEEDDDCKGGLRWQKFSFSDGYNYKDATSNGNFFLLAARLAKLTQNSTFIQWADKSFTWAKDVGIVRDDYIVLNGAFTSSQCAQLSYIQYTSIQAIYTEGAAVMFNLTNGAQNWTDAVKGFVNSTSLLLDEDDVLVEVVCESAGHGKCVDERAFKGVAARSLARAAISAPIVADPIKKVLKASAKGAANGCTESDGDIACKLSWEGNNTRKEPASAKEGNLGEIFSALEVVQWLLYPHIGTVLGSDGGSQADASESGTASGTSGAVSPQKTGFANSTAGSLALVFVVAFATMLSC